MIIACGDSPAAMGAVWFSKLYALRGFCQVHLDGLPERPVGRESDEQALRDRPVGLRQLRAKIWHTDQASVLGEHVRRRTMIGVLERLFPLYPLFKVFDEADIFLAIRFEQEASQVAGGAVLPGLDPLGRKHAAERARLGQLTDGPPLAILHGRTGRHDFGADEVGHAFIDPIGKLDLGFVSVNEAVAGFVNDHLAEIVAVIAAVAGDNNFPRLTQMAQAVHVVECA